MSRTYNAALACVAGLLVTAAMVGVHAGEPPDAKSTAPTARLPDPPGPYAPSNAKLAAGHVWDEAAYLDVDACGTCHAEVVAEWRRSPHAHASFDNPFYRVSVDRFRAAQGHAASQFCAGCHDPAMLFARAMLNDVDLSEPRTRVGVACLSCHRVTETTPDGNGSYVLAPEPLTLPKPGHVASLVAHRRQMTPTPLGRDALCVSCHRSFASPEVGVPHHFAGQDDGGAKAGSAWGGSQLLQLDPGVAKRRCVSCHMPRDGGDRHRRHDVLGAHSGVAQAHGQAALDRVAAFVSGAVTVNIAAVTPLIDAEVEGLTFDVVLANREVGHRFPGGAMDLQDTWLEVEVRAADGALVASAGTDHATTGDDPTAHRLISTIVDERAEVTPFHDVDTFRTVVANHTLAPRDAAVVRYRLRTQDAPVFPLTVQARLRHRRYPEDFRLLVTHMAAATAAANSLDPQLATPILEVGQARRTVAKPGVLARGWRPLYHYALALLHGRQEAVHEAEQILRLAAAAASSDAERAATWVLVARVAIAEHRTDAALQALAEAGKLAPGRAALDFQEGEAYAAVWRWSNAAAAYERAASKAAMDPKVWHALAGARSNAGDASGAFEAARRGLALRPRHAGLLRTQALALQALGADAVTVAKAVAAFSAHRPDDAHASRRAHCGHESPLCEAIRQPIRSIDLRRFREPPGPLTAP